MKHIIIPFALLLLSLLTSAQDATEIVQSAYEKVNGTSSYAEMTMKIVRPDWNRSISMKSWSKGMKYSMVYITAPAQEKGQVFMKRDNEMWNWQPKINRMVKLPPSMMMQSWMGSDFTNDDLINQASIVNDYTHKILDKEEINGQPCYKIQFIPKEDAPVVWGKLISWVSKDGHHMFRTEYYDEDDYLVKTELASDVKTMDGEEITTKFTTIPADKEGHKTIMIMKEVDFNHEIEDGFFSQMNMKRIR
ncbi:MAG TPA: outer membrane lipoprotein-sorting protein [Bacteroidales bacterium]|nr:outer membrane lipoprotein-sorting protein [Bacteroidales bacterium]